MHFFSSFLIIVFCSLVFIADGLVSPDPVFAASSPLEMETEDEQLVRWDLSADSVTTLNDSEILEAKGNVYLRRGSEYLKADFARYYMSTKWVFLQGNVVVRMGKDELKAEEAEFDLRSRVGWLTKGQIFMEGPHAYLAGERIDKHWGDVYTFKKAKVTTCDGDVPAWSLTADEAIVEIDGYARLTRSSFQVKDVPVAFTPYFIFPTKTNRQTGLLIPEYGRSSTKGFFFNQPFFWAINESSDMTFNEYIMEKRGFMHGVEYRTRPSTETSGWLRFDWMHDRETDGSLDSGHYNRDSYVRTNNSRYWVRGMFDTTLFDGDWRFKSDLDYISDQDYLSEFSRGFSGFRRTQGELFSLFNRDLQERYRDRVSGALLARDWERVSVSLFGQYTQNVHLNNGNTPSRSDSTVQRLPQFDAFLHKGRVFESFPLEASISSQAAYMYRRNGTRGGRYEVFPMLTMPLTSEYGSIITTGGLRQTIYGTEHSSHSGPAGRQGPRENDESRTLPEFSTAGFTELARVYEFDNPALLASNSTIGQSRWVGLRHSMQPRVEYAYRPVDNQDNNPYYDSEDRLMPRSLLLYSLTNVLTRKKEEVVQTKNDDGVMEPVVREKYIDLLRLRVEQAYDIREATRDDDRDVYERRPYGDIFSDLTFGYNEYVSMYGRSDWSPYLNDFTRHQSGLGLFVPDYGRFSLGYDFRKKINEYNRFRPNDIQYISLGADIQLPLSLSLSGQYNYDFKNTGNDELDLSLTYSHQCFQLVGKTIIEPEEKSYHLMFVFTGLGD